MSVKTRCKFQCESIMRTLQDGAETIKFRAVGSGRANGEDANFSEWTPWGLLEITVTNPAVVGQYKPGDVIYLDLIPAE